MSGIANFFEQFLHHPSYLVEIALIYLLIYTFFRFTEGSRGAGILKGIALVMIFFLVVTMILAERLQLDRISFILKFFSAASFTALIVIFQPELRRALVRLGQTPIFGALLRGGREPIAEIVKAAYRMAKNKVGALVAIEREVGLGGYIERGVPIDGEVRSELLVTIFYPGTELHDGAVVVRQGRIAAAGCLFPLSDNPNLGKSLGTRHRAGVGVTEETDAVCVIVSEETGAVSLAVRGQLYRGLDPKELERMLGDLYAQLEGQREVLPAPKPAMSPAPEEEAAVRP